MIDIFVYPVSAIMKLWHLILHSFLGDQTAWLVSIPLLVLTVRSLIWPLNWSAIRSGRRSALMRPELAALNAELAQATTTADIAAHKAKVKEVHERYHYRPVAGCLIPFIMVPVFIGLYQVILRMARPSFTGAIGLISADEVEDFRSTTLAGVPLPAYVSMPESWATQYGVTGGEVRHLIMPLLLAALAATFINMCISCYRGFLTTQFDKTMPRRMLYLLAFFAVLTPYLLWNAAIHGPVPVAVILYWFTSNLYTLTQTLVNETLLRRRYPLSDAAHAARRESWQRHRASRKIPRAERRAQKKAAKAEAKRVAELRAQLLREEREAKKSGEES